ncbi:MAG: hypothetical protein HZB10_00365 [Candidatus Yonathbacteria bacterium]|nr:hypothetical protein [Candidatus Yonathbacteria bacterium]
MGELTKKENQNDAQKVSDDYVKRAYEKWKKDDQLEEAQRQNKKKESGEDK